MLILDPKMINFLQFGYPWNTKTVTFPHFLIPVIRYNFKKPWRKDLEKSLKILILSLKISHLILGIIRTFLEIPKQSFFHISLFLSLVKISEKCNEQIKSWIWAQKCDIYHISSIKRNFFEKGLLLFSLLIEPLLHVKNVPILRKRRYRRRTD